MLARKLPFGVCVMLGPMFNGTGPYAQFCLQ